MKKILFIMTCSVLLAAPVRLNAKTGYEAWLRYAALDDSARAKYESLPASVTIVGDSAILRSAQDELIRGLRSMLGRTLRFGKGEPKERAFVLGTLRNIPGLRTRNDIAPDGFWLTSSRINGFDSLIIAGSTDRGVLYGVFALLSKMARNENVSNLNEVQQSYA